MTDAQKPPIDEATLRHAFGRTEAAEVPAMPLSAPVAAIHDDANRRANAVLAQLS